MPLIVIEGLDGTGKNTQAKLLEENLPKSHMIDFPRYNRPSSTLVKEYLAGRTSPDPTTENPYAASSYYACDRVISYQKEHWAAQYKIGLPIIMDRYLTSNLIYQAAKLNTPKERKSFREWAWDYEINRLRLPPPDVVIYLSLDPRITFANTLKRAQNGESHDSSLNGQMDLHESNLTYQKACHQSAIEAAYAYNWITIPCENENNSMRSIEDIHNDIMNVMRQKGFLS